MIDISKYSGKCDLGDTCEIFGVDNIVSKYKIYTHNNIIPLAINSYHDILPYYPYIVGMMVSDNENGGGQIWLSDESYVDTEEREHLEWFLSDAIKYWNRCKKNKVPFDKDECYKTIDFFNHNQPYKWEIVNRVAEHGKNATIDGIHMPLSDTYRKHLCDDMVEAGWGKNNAIRWCYGWDRMLTMGDK